MKMQNQAAVEALYSATFVEDYLDCVENLPNDLQRHLSRLREFDLRQYTELLKDLDYLISAFENETSPAGQRNILSKIQHGLIAAQDVGDDKLITVQAMADLIENKSRQLDHDSKILDFGKDDEEEQIVEPKQKPEKTTSTSSVNANVKTAGTPASSSAKPKSETKEPSGKGGSVKRRNKKSLEGSKAGRNQEDRDDDEVSTVSSRSGGGQRARGSAGNKRAGVKRKATTKKSSNYDKDDSDREVDLSNMDIDQDEPTYCLCEQVSYGEMVGCDNDLCPIEWFHFNCVQVSSKPKGKWFCPKCRGDKANVMKPRAQFLKELANFNKEQEAKRLKKNS